MYNVNQLAVVYKHGKINHSTRNNCLDALSSPLKIRLKTCSSRKKLSSLAKSNLDSVLLVSEDEVKGSPFPFEGRGEDQTSLVKVLSLEELHRLFLIVSFLPCAEEQEDMVRSSRP